MFVRRYRTVGVAALFLALGGLSTGTALKGQEPWAPPRAVVLESAPVLLTADAGRTPLRVLQVGTTVEVLEMQGAWLNVRFADPQFGPRVGFVEARLLRIRPTAVSPPAVASPAPLGVGSLPVTERVPGAGAMVAAPPVTERRRNPSPIRIDAKPGSAMKSTKIRGYVTELRSPTDFDVEDYRITQDHAFALDFENASPEIMFHLSDIRVGVELEIKGLLDAGTGELKATGIKVDLEQFKSLKQTAFVSRAPEGLQRLDGSWAGELHADGQIIRVSNATRVTFKPTAREKDAPKMRESDEREDEAEGEPLRTLDQVSVGMVMTYEGKRDRESGRVLADRIQFSTNELEKGEAKLWKSLRTSIKGAQGLKPGELKIDRVGKFSLVPDERVQAYVTAIGERLIPQYQRELALDAPGRIPFAFHVVASKDVNAFATANGIVVINSGLIDLLENEAQLAAIIGHEIAHATHEHTWRAQQFHKKARFGIAIAGALANAYGISGAGDLANMVNGAIVNGHSRSMENQSDRLGLEYMVAAGYDPRQAPAVWKLMAKANGVHATDFFWSNHDNETTRRSYLMNELKNNYRDLQYGALRVNTTEYGEIKEAVAASVDATKRLQVR